VRFFAPQGQHVDPMGVKFGTKEDPPPCQIAPPSVQRQGYRSPKTEMFTEICQNVEYKRPAGACP